MEPDNKKSFISGLGVSVLASIIGAIIGRKVKNNNPDLPL